MIALFFILLISFKIEIWCFPQLSVSVSNPLSSSSAGLSTMNAAQLLQSQPQSDKLGPSVFGVPNSPNMNYPNSYVNSYINPGTLGSLGLNNLQRLNTPQNGSSNNYRENSPVPFTGQVFSSIGNLGSSAINAKTQSLSNILDGVSYGMSRVPSIVGYGVQSVGRLEKTGEHLLKAALDLGIGGISNGMEGLTLGMNMINGLGNAGMKGISTIANGSLKIFEHILSLGTAEGGLINTLIALGRLMSPAQLANFQNSGLSLNSLLGAARYLGIPNNNTYLNTIVSAAKQLSNGVNVDSMRQKATNAVNSLGLSQAWKQLSSLLNTNGNGGTTVEAIQAAAVSNNPLPSPPSVTNSQSLTNGQSLPSSSITGSNTSVGTNTDSSSWLSSWMG